MKIRLVRDVPVDQRHNMVAGRELEVDVFEPDAHWNEVRYWVRGDGGEMVGIFKGEAEVIDGELPA